MDELIDQVVLPGDVIGTVTGEKKIRLGPGLMQDEDSIMATKAGLLRYKAERYWVENTQKRVRNVSHLNERCLGRFIVLSPFLAFYASNVIISDVLAIK